MKKRSLLSVLFYLVGLALLFSWVFSIFGGGTDDLSYSQVVQLFQQEQVKNFTVEDQKIYLELHNPYQGKTKLTCNMADPEAFHEQMRPLLETQSASGVLESYDFLPTSGISPYDFVLPLLIVGGVLLILWFLVMGRLNGGGNNPMAQFGRARTVLGMPDGQKVTFDDVAGADEEKQELQEIVDFLRNPEKFKEIGARIPHGLLLVGPPGTGKTLLARAVAGEAGVQFLSISGSLSGSFHISQYFISK